MADLVWYYARGEIERGPFTSAQIRELVKASKVRPEDLVWKEGMENWTVAREVAELFPEAGLVGESTANSGLETGSAAPRELEGNLGQALALPADVRGAFYRVARLLVLLGIVLVLATSGCESLGERRVARLNALAERTVQEQSPEQEESRQTARNAAWEHQAAGFTRGVAFHLGLAMLLPGSIGLLLLAENYERGLGAGLVLAMVLAALLRAL